MVETPDSTVVFRVDASEKIGIGHVMRCLTLAGALKRMGIPSHFICRDHPGHMGSFICDQGFGLDLLPCTPCAPESSAAPYASWLGGKPEHDINACQDILNRMNPRALVFDHYAIGAEIHSALRTQTPLIGVIDDLADRPYDCDILLDQTFGRDVQDYAPLTPPQCRILTGASFALLRPEFANARPAALARRATAQLQNILVTMGGTDPQNYTADVLDALSALAPDDFEECSIRVVLGASAPHAKEVARQAQAMSHPVELILGADNMAELMQTCDFAIGAAGSTVWERCCLGLSGIIIVLADNQRTIARNLEASGAVLKLEQIKTENGKSTLRSCIKNMKKSPKDLALMSQKAAQITDGTGANHIAQLLKAGIA